MKRAVIIETQLKQYRRRFMIDLAAALGARDVELKVAYSAPTPRELARGDAIELEAPIGIKIPGLHLWNDRIVVQHAWPVVRDADLVIIEQGNKQMFNYVLLVLSQLRLKRVAFWGHGYNHQAQQLGASEWFKQRLLRRVDWWFSYTDGVTGYLVAHGVDPRIISTVRNTIDVEELTCAIAHLDGDARATARRKLGLSPAASIGVYCGALVAAKQLGFLVDAAAEIHRCVPEFALVVIGDGPERPMLEAIAQYRPYIRVVGPAFGAARGHYFAIADICLIPAQVGLGIVDAFAAGVPIATTTAPGHGPEIEYLEPGDNGVVTAFEIEPYAAEITRLLGDRAALAAMRSRALATAAELPMTQMVERFADGVVRCMELGS